MHQKRVRVNESVGKFPGQNSYCLSATKLRVITLIDVSYPKATRSSPAHQGRPASVPQLPYITLSASIPGQLYPHAPLNYLPARQCRHYPP